MEIKLALSYTCADGERAGGGLHCMAMNDGADTCLYATPYHTFHEGMCNMPKACMQEFSRPGFGHRNLEFRYHNHVPLDATDENTFRTTLVVCMLQILGGTGPGGRARDNLGPWSRRGYHGTEVESGRTNMNNVFSGSLLIRDMDFFNVLEI